MADDTSTTTTAGTTVTYNGLPSLTPSPEAPATGAEEQSDDLGEAGKKALAAERAAKKAAEKQLAELTKRLTEYEDRDKSEAQKLAERAQAAEQERDALLLTAMRQRVALNKGLPAALADRLKGSTEDEMSADADELLALVPNAQPPAPFMGGPRPDLTQGARGGTGLSGDSFEQDLKRMFKGR